VTGELAERHRLGVGLPAGGGGRRACEELAGGSDLVVELGDEGGGNGRGHGRDVGKGSLRYQTRDSGAATVRVQSIWVTAGRRRPGSARRQRATPSSGAAAAGELP
jgi:hypothetical protein